MRTLLLSVDTYKGESLKSYLMRLSMVNGYESISWIYILSNISRRSTYFLSPRNNDLRILEELSRLSSSELWNLTFVNEFDDYLTENNYSKLIYKTGLSSKYSKVCPQCLEEEKYEKKLWDLSINLACHKHGTLLINKCCNCHKLISSTRSSIEHCTCGYALKDLPILQASNHIIEIAKLLHHSSIEKADTKLFQKNPLQVLSLIHIVSLLTFFSRQMSIYLGYTNLSNKVSTIDKNSQQLLNDTFNIFFNWPHNYYAFLDKLQKNRGVREGGARLQLSGVYIGIHRKFTLPIFSFLRDEFYNYMQTNKNRTYKIVRSKISRNEETNFLNFIETTKILGMKPDKVKKLVENNILDGTYKIFNGHEQVLIRKDSIERYKNLMDSNLSLKAVSKYLGITTKKILELQKEGLIKAIIGPHIGLKEWLFSKESTQNLLTNLLRIDRNDETTSGNKAIDFSQALRYAAQYGMKINDFINLISNKVISPVNIQKDNIGLNQLKFNIEEVVEEFKKWRLENSNELSSLDISHIIGENYDYIQMWLIAGLIKNNRENQGRNRVSRECLLQFQENYISLNRISIKLNIHSTELRRVLLKHNIYPIFGTGKVGGYLYLKKDVLKFLDNT